MFIGSWFGFEDGRVERRSWRERSGEDDRGEGGRGFRIGTGREEN